MIELEVGAAYARAELLSALTDGARTKVGGDWATGYMRVGDDALIFCNVGTAGRTGPDYPNRWIDRDLLWYGRRNSKVGQDLIDGMVGGALRVHLFWRGRDRGPFTYAGVVRAESVWGEHPVEVLWRTDNAPSVQEPAPKPPVWRRGPPPSVGAVTSIRDDGPTHLYLMALTTRADAHFVPSSAVEGRSYVKVGISQNPAQRLSELNSGLPKTLGLAWTLIDTRLYDTGWAAYAAESRVLEELRMANLWVSGEFALVHNEQAADLLTLAAE